MERSRQLTLFLFLFVAIFSSATAEPSWPPPTPCEPSSSPCDPRWLAAMASDCQGGLEEPRLPCCVMVVASVGIGFGDPVPCLCLVVREPAFVATGLNVDDVLKMYRVCQGGLPVGPHTADACKGIN